MRTGHIAVTLGKSSASLGLSGHLIFNWGSDETVPVHQAPNPLDAPDVLWSLSHAELPRSSPSAFVLLGQTPHPHPHPGRLPSRPTLMGKGGAGGGGFGLNHHPASGAGASTVVQRELLVPLQSFMQLFILALNRVALFLDVVVRIVFAITGKAEKGGSLL